MSALMDRATFEKNFGVFWQELMSGRSHLDSMLSRATPAMKSLLAQIAPRILRQPASYAQEVGLGMEPGEPWSLREPVDARTGAGGAANRRLADWPAARQLAAGLFDSKWIDPKPIAEDFPPEMLAEWRADFGDEVCAKLVQVLGQSAPMALRFARKANFDESLETLRSLAKSEHWADQGFAHEPKPAALAPHAIALEGYAPVLNTAMREKGLFEIQDEGSQILALISIWPELFASLLSEKPGTVRWRGERPMLPSYPGKALTIVDACAGAGGKTLALADYLGGRGRVYAYDTSEKKLQALRRRGRLAGYNSIQTALIRDGEETAMTAKFAGRADVVLVDAPCSGWGVLRRNPDTKWKQTPADLARLPALQERLLTSYAGLVRPGGRLVYAVCTFRPEETRAIRDRFLASADGAHFRPAAGGYLGPGPCDGFYVQVFERAAAAGKKGAAD